VSDEFKSNKIWIRSGISDPPKYKGESTAIWAGIGKKSHMQDIYANESMDNIGLFIKGYTHIPKFLLFKRADSSIRLASTGVDNRVSILKSKLVLNNTAIKGGHRG
jgi:hypothetical protein